MTIKEALKQIEQITKPDSRLGYCDVDLLEVTRTVHALAKLANKLGKGRGTK
jgi:hypothetical protein